MPVAVPIVATGPQAVERAGEGLVAVEGLRAGEAGELGRDVGQREGPGRAGGDRREVEDRPPGRIGVVRELEDRVGEEGRQAGRVPGRTVPAEEGRLVATQASQPGRGTSRIQAPSTQ